MVLSAVIVGFRPLGAGFDTQVYIQGFYLIQNSESILTVHQDIESGLGIGSEFLFWSLAYIFAKLGIGEQWFLYAIAVSSISILFFGLRLIFGGNALLYFFAFVVCGTFYNTFGNAIRQAFVLALVPYFIYYRYYRFSYKNLLLLSIVAFGFHKFSAVLLFFIIVLTFIRLKWIVLLFFSSILGSTVVGKLIYFFVPYQIYTKAASVYTNAPFILLNFTAFSILLLYFFRLRHFVQKYFIFESVFVPFLLFSALSNLFAFNEFAYNRVANFAYMMQVFSLVYISLTIFKQRKFMASFVICVVLIWAVFILNTSSVAIILYG
nr:EpsG family protein [Shewanella jiangmenensis]